MSDHDNNPFRDLAVQRQGQSAVVEIEQSRAVAEVKGQVMMAKMYPRDPVAAMDRILGECNRPALAELASYSYPRGGKEVTGPSIRLAEVIARHWGNIAYGTVELSRVGGESSMLAYAWDLESNVMARREFVVRHIRDKRDGNQVLTDERDVYELTANMGSRRVRACILAIVPKDVSESAEKQCADTLKAKIGNLEEKIKSMVAMFSEIGVTKLMLEKRLRHRIEATSVGDIISLGRIYNSIQDGMSVVTDYFEYEPTEKQEPSSPQDVAKTAAKRAAGRPKKEEPKEPEQKSEGGLMLRVVEEPEAELGIF